jgi:hypothetical protein
MDNLGRRQRVEGFVRFMKQRLPDVMGYARRTSAT